MPARAVLSGTISFGLVSVPVSLFSTSESSASVSFNMLDKKTGTRLKQQYVVPTDSNRVVEKDEIAKGYEFSKGQYVVFSPEELKALDEKATNSIDIAEFVPLDKIDRVYLDKAYFLGPDKGGERAYHLLAKALVETGRAALGQYAAQRNQTISTSGFSFAYDADGDSITQYQIIDNTTDPRSGHWVVNGVAQAAGTPITLTPALMAASTSYGVSPIMTASPADTRARFNAARMMSGSGFDSSASSLDVAASMRSAAPASSAI